MTAQSPYAEEFLLDTDFGVGEEFTHKQEDAFPPESLPMPQFLASVPKKSLNQWPPALIIDLALELDCTEDILTRYSLVQSDLDKLYRTPAFRRDVGMMQRELRENGVTFSRKAALQAENYLDNMDTLMFTSETPASTKLEIFKTMTKLGKLEPKEDKDDGNQGTQINVQINL